MLIFLSGENIHFITRARISVVRELDFFRKRFRISVFARTFILRKKYFFLKISNTLKRNLAWNKIKGSLGGNDGGETFLLIIYRITNKVKSCSAEVNGSEQT